MIHYGYGAQTISQYDCDSVGDGASTRNLADVTCIACRVIAERDAVVDSDSYRRIARAVLAAVEHDR